MLRASWPLIEITYSFLDQVRTSKTNKDLYEILDAVTREIGFRYFALVHHVDLRRRLSDVICLENYPLPWAQHFIENGLYAEDPIHRACLTSNVGFLWADVPKMIRMSGRQQQILESAAKHGLGYGYTVPAIIPGEYSGSCSFATRRGKSAPSRNLMLAQLIGAFAFQAARRLTRKSPPSAENLPSLTPRQRDCLLLAIQGKTDWEISRILGLSEKTVSQHLDMARARYGVTKRLPLAIRAIYDGQISFVEALDRQFLLKPE